MNREHECRGAIFVDQIQTCARLHEEADAFLVAPPSRVHEGCPAVGILDIHGKIAVGLTVARTTRIPSESPPSAALLNARTSARSADDEPVAMATTHSRNTNHDNRPCHELFTTSS